MNIKPKDRTIKDILLSKSQYVIPRFQREYSWEKRNYKEFLHDMIKSLRLEEGKILADNYFVGTMLFVGKDTDTCIDVVDGQQRLTTSTVLFSAISDRFRDCNENVLSERIFEYIMTKDDNGEPVRILKSETHYPFFSYFIQDINKENKNEPETEEEENIKQTFEYFYDALEKTKLQKIFGEYHGKELVEAYEYKEMLKAIRDQVLNCTVVSIMTEDRKQANMIFEILNAKGKRLTSIDLIKNKIFEILDEQEPADFADEMWKKIKSAISQEGYDVGMATFFRHYWLSNYNKCPEKQLYDNFNKEFKKNKEKYKKLLHDLEYASQNYIKIVYPNLKDFDNKKEYLPIVQSLHVISNYFNITQTRIAILSLLNAKDKGKIKLTGLKDILKHMENFHFVYNAIGAEPTNRLETIYSKFAIALNKAETKDKANEEIEKLKNDLSNLYISYNEFETKFIKLTYTKRNSPVNVKTKYVINKMNSYFEKKEIFERDLSMEHIISESASEECKNIGNLIALEMELNKEADSLGFDEKIDIYKKSKYSWVKIFINENNEEWNLEKSFKRSEEMAKIYYEKILGKEISGNNTDEET